MAQTLPIEMRNPRKATPFCHATKEAWWYIERGGISVLASASTVGEGRSLTTGVRLTRRQLELALKIINAHRKD